MASGIDFIYHFLSVPFLIEIYLPFLDFAS